MGSVGRAAIFRGVGQPLEIKEYPVPEPGPGAALVRITLANVCGSDLHTWRGDLDPAKRGRALPAHQGHEGTGRIAALGEGVTDRLEWPAAAGRRPGRVRLLLPVRPLQSLLERQGLDLPESNASARDVV